MRPQGHACTCTVKMSKKIKEELDGMDGMCQASDWIDGMPEQDVLELPKMYVRERTAEAL